MSMVPPVPVPVADEVAVLPPGLVLAGLLDEMDVELVSGFDVVTVLEAEYRLLCRQAARFYRVVLETGLREPFSVETVERVRVPGEFAAEETRAALVWSRARAERALGFAVDIFDRLPTLGEAMLAGRLDEPRARAFAEWTRGLTDAQADTVCAQLVPQAAGLTVGALIDRIKRACLAIDPGWAEKKYREAVNSRRVAGSRNPDGTANLGGYSQPLDRVAAASERIDVLARACKHAGDTRPIDHIRSDLFLGMTDGSYETMDEHQIVDHVLAHPYTAPAEPDDILDTETDGTDDDGSDKGTDDDGDGDGRDDSDDGGDGGGTGRGDDGGGPGGPVQDAGLPDSRQPVSDAAGVCADLAAPPVPSTPAASLTGWAAAPEVRIELGTLLGADERPGELPPWGFIPAALARQLVASMAAGQWRFVFCGRRGHAVAGGLLRARPRTGGRVRRDSRRGGIVEIAIPLRELARLAAAADPPGGPWAPVLTELAGHADQLPPDTPESTGAGAGAVETADNPESAGTAESAGALDPAGTAGAAAAGDGDAPGTAAGVGEERRRVPGAVLRRWVAVRDRRCSHPCCRVPARVADQDHRVTFAAGGATSEQNLEPKCRHDHRLKDEAGWATSQPEPGLTVWTSPLGRRYSSRPPPVIPPAPEPDPDLDRDRYHIEGWLTYPSRPQSEDLPGQRGQPDDNAGSPDEGGPILPPSPQRVPDEQDDREPEPAAIFDPDEQPPF